MASRATCALAILLVTGFTSYALKLDEDATNDAIAASSASENREVAILLRGPHDKVSRREELLHGKVSDESAFSLFYNSKSNKVSLESLHGGHLKSVSWGLGSHPRETLLLILTHDKVKLYVGCQPLHWHPMSGRHDILNLLSNKKFKMYHEEYAPVDIYDSETAGLNAMSCDHHELSPPTLVAVDSDVEEVKDFIAREERLKREEMQGDDYRTNYIDPNILPTLPPPTPPATQRGDIPNMDIESCDDEIIRQLKLLRQTVELLRREVGDQRGIIDGLASQLRACCSRVPAPPPVERCSGNSCYPGYTRY